MKRTVIDKTALKKKSEELKIPFSEVLGGFVLESFMYLVSESGFAEYLWLKNSSVLGAEQHRRKNILTLEFAYITDEAVVQKGLFQPGQKLSLKMAYVMLASVLKKEKVPEIKWRGRAEWKNDVVEFDITGEFEEMTVPLHIKIRECGDEEMLPISREHALMMDSKQKIHYLEYPIEDTLTELLFSIVNHMELLAEMKTYEQVYQILKKETVDGRHIKEKLEARCKQEEISLERDRVDTIISYKNYTYMRKRFEKYLRSCKKKEPSWDEVMEKLEAFLPRVWQSICQDTVFFGDWMPELGRFLE